MSFALTEPQLMDGSKTVTRRTGWQNLKPGTRLLAVRKAMGLKAGEKVQPLCEIEITSVRRERIDVITPATEQDWLGARDKCNARSVLTGRPKF